MIYALVALVFAIGGYLGFLQISNKKLRNENSQLKTQQRTQEWKTEIDQAKVKVTETERDYNEAKEGFRRKYNSLFNGSDDGGNN